MSFRGAKDAILRLLNLGRLNGHGGGPRTGGQLAQIALPDQLLSAPTAVRDPHGPLVLVGTSSALSAYRVTVSGRPGIRLAWRQTTGATSPIVAGGLIYAYDPSGTGLHVDTLNGSSVWTVPAGSGHWSRPIIAAGIIALPEGSANNRLTGGVLDLYH